MTTRTQTPTRLERALDGRPVAWLAARLTEESGRHYSRQRVWSWVAGQHRPSQANRNLIAKVLRRRVWDLFPTCVECGTPTEGQKWCSMACFDEEPEE